MPQGRDLAEAGLGWAGLEGGCRHPIQTSRGFHVQQRLRKKAGVRRMPDPLMFPISGRVIYFRSNLSVSHNRFSVPDETVKRWLYASPLSAQRAAVLEGTITMWFVRTPIMCLCTNQTKASNRDVLVFISEPPTVSYINR